MYLNFSTFSRDRARGKNGLELDVLFTSKWIFIAWKVRNLRPGFQGLSFPLLPGVREEGRKIRGPGNEVWEFRAPLNWKLIWKPFLVSWGLQSVRQWFTKDLFSVGGFIFSFQTTWYSLENCAFIHLKIIHSYTHAYSIITWSEITWPDHVSSHGLKWENKPPKLKRSIFSLYQ